MCASKMAVSRVNPGGQVGSCRVRSGQVGLGRLGYAGSDRVGSNCIDPRM